MPNDSTRIASESSLVIMDIVIELEDHSIANVEVQKLGYKFSGQRAACYSSDLLFRKILHNNGIRNKLDAWLTFLSVDEPETIVKLITEYPQFKKYYEEIYQLCLNTEKMMNMFSKELQELDRNTVQYMIDEMQDVIDSQKETIKNMQKDHEQGLADLAEKDRELAELRAKLAVSKESF